MRTGVTVLAFLMLSSSAFARADKLFAKDNLLAWCIVPFDGMKRGPEDRVAMLKRLGFQHYAYDWRDVHLPTFDAELVALKRADIKLDAVWFPATLDKNAKFLLEKLEQHKIQTQLWVTMNGGATAKDAAEQRAKIEQHAKALRPIIDAAAKIGCSVGLYNHGAWFGEPDNQLAIIKELNAKNVGIVYNLHHGHSQLSQFPELLAKMTPHLYALNLNGMIVDGDRKGKKILVLGQGDEDVKILKTIAASTYRGPIGIIGHTDDDAEARLRDNLDGLAWLVPQLRGATAGPKPTPRTKN
jgi:sugar phosphate isomerase/epimerase